MEVALLGSSSLPLVNQYNIHDMMPQIDILLANQYYLGKTQFTDT